MSEAAIEQPEDQAAAQRSVPQISPKTALVHHAGFGYKHVIFSAPTGLSVQDLNDHPEI